MHVLGIETSCDETAAAIVSDEHGVLSNVIASQIALHRPYGGVVPEIACRSHVEQLPGILESAVSEAGLTWPDVDAVAVTYGPGLASSLLVGLSAAKALAQELNRPLIAVNHLEGHLHSIFLDPTAPPASDACPMLVLLVSGGHTALIRVEAPGRYRILGQTLDDAAGEAFDKGATILGLPYPGGPEIQRCAEGGDPAAIHFPRSRQLRGARNLNGMNADHCFSFSGLKTALLYYMRDNPDAPQADVAASYQEAVVDALIDRSSNAIDPDTRTLAAVGGVALNSRLRERLADLAGSRNLNFIPAGRAYCTDNAAMIAGVACAGYGLRGDIAMQADASPSLVLS